MAKHKTVKEMMAERKPLTRTSVEPVNIYSTPPVVDAPEVKQARVPTQKPKPMPTKDAAVAQDETDPLRPYSTYLFKGQIKGIKQRALNRDINDMDIVQEAMDEYFKNHPL